MAHVISGLIVLIVIVVGSALVNTADEIPQFLLIARERLRPGAEDAYDANESKLASACATLGCPHAYLALATTRGPKEVWWFNAFTSKQEMDGLDATYAQNGRLMAALRPLGKRKADFRESFTSTTAELRRVSSGASIFRISGARFFVVHTASDAPLESAAVFKAPGGRQFIIASFKDRVSAEAGSQSSRGAVILLVQPRWSFPARSWIDADPEFWRENPVARGLAPIR
jgi:hypothetical protein